MRHANHPLTVFVLALIGAIVLSAFGAQPAAAADRSFTLYVSDTEGWGVTNTSLSIPGPRLTVDEGDNVTLRLNATAGDNHRWFIDYDNDATDDGNEPNSPAFNEGDAAITWNFTASRNGTFVYRSRNHESMWGLIDVLAPGATPESPSVTSDNTGAIVAGAAVLAIGAFVAGTMIGRRMRTPPPPPPPD